MITEKKRMSKSLKLIIEALLFSSDKPLAIKDIRDCLPDTDIKDIKSALTILEHDLEAMERSFNLKEVAGGYQLRSRPEYGAYILRMLQSTPNRLSRAAMETLAIVAYKQPILRHEIEKLRGVDVGGILKTLMEKDLVKIMGRKDLPGKPLIYGTTKRFLEVFDLKDISSLPKMNEIKDFGLSPYEPTPLNQDNPLQPQGTEGLRSTDQTVEVEPEISEDRPAPDMEIEREEFHGDKPEADTDSVSGETFVDMQAEHEEPTQEELDDEADEEEYEDMISDEVQDDFDPDYKEEDDEEDEDYMNGEDYSDDNLSENGDEDDSKN
jgi:segregation and condensation protein B